MTKQTEYSKLMLLRKKLQFEGKNKEALKVQDQAEALVQAGKVSREELKMAAYL